MRLSILAALAATLLVTAAARAQQPAPDPPICNGSLHAWADIAGGSDVAAVQQLYARALPACRNLRAQMQRRIAALQHPTPRPPVTNNSHPNTTTTTTVAPPPSAPVRRIVEFDDCSAAGWCPRMVVIPSGGFTMGSPDNEPGHTADESPQRRVSVRQFAASKFEITFNQWAACVSRGGCRGNANPSDQGWGRGDRPVINVNWNDAQDYARWLSDQTRQRYRLLSEAEWEYAARAGATGAYWTGTAINATQANFGARSTRPVGAYPPNRFGLFDIAGNAWEWVQDCATHSYAGLPADGSANTAHCDDREYRGGAYYSGAEALRSANRSGKAPSDRGQGMGFRVARDY